ncbi:MAG: envelope stress response membrane protein PspC [Parvularculaceae bacterium]
MPERHHHHHHYWGERSGYARRAGEPGPGPRRHAFGRNPRDGKFAGVCAGLADYFGWNVKYVRLGFVLSTFFAFPMPIFIYVGMALFVRPAAPVATQYETPSEANFWRAYATRPKVAMSELKHRFRALDARIADMERAVTSNEYALRRQFRDLERGR